MRLAHFLAFCSLLLPVLAPALEHDLGDGPLPWTSKPLRDAPGDFSFVVMSDNTGGSRAGVFASAVPMVNALGPAFVLSIGDLVDGYTEDQRVIDAQWAEFEAIIDGLDAPFVRVPGNHDVSNAFLAEDWRRRFGHTYYHFTHNDVLFLVLDTEDPPRGGIGEAQAAWARGVLERNAGARWTFVLMHRPLWDYGDKMGFERVEPLLEGRPHTILSGHHHNYLMAEENGGQRLVLATTGGGSLLRGASVGEFDHVTQVTMREDGPRIAHLALDGFVPVDIVTREKNAFVEPLRTGSWMQLDATLAPSGTETRAMTTLRLVNDAAGPLRVAGDLPAIEGAAFTPARVEVSVPAGETLELPLSLDAARGIASLPPVHVTLSASHDIPGSGVVELPASRRWVIDWIREILPAGSTATWVSVPHPGLVQEDWDWKGAGDLLLEHAVAWDDDHLVIRARTRDDVVHAMPGEPATARMDKFLLRVRTASGADVVDAQVATGSRVAGTLPDGATLDCEAIDGGIEATLRIPHAALDGPGGEAWQRLRLAIGTMDVDRPENTKPSVIWTSPPFGHWADHEGSGSFRRAGM